jgi:hypothetical protein
MKLVLNELDQDANEYKQRAVWNPDEDEEIPDEFLAIYPEGTWQNRPPEYFIERIDGPYSMLTQVPDDEEVTIEPREESPEPITEADSEADMIEPESESEPDDE